MFGMGIALSHYILRQTYCLSVAVASKPDFSAEHISCEKYFFMLLNKCTRTFSSCLMKKLLFPLEFFYHMVLM